MNTNQTLQKKDRPQIVKLDKALDLAWTRSYSSWPSKFVPSDDPLERKLRSKLVAGRNAAKTAGKSTLAAGDDDEDDDEDSRTWAFERKRPSVPVYPSFQAKRKKK